MFTDVFADNTTLEPTQNTNEVKQNRDKFMVSLRREQRTDIIAKKRQRIIEQETPQDDPQSLKSAIDLSHLDSVPWGEEIKPKVTEFFECDVSTDKIFEYIKALSEEDRVLRHWGYICLRKALSSQTETHNIIQLVIDHNVVPMLISKMQDYDDPHCQVEATWAVTNMASGTSEQTLCLVEKGVIKILVHLLGSNYITLLEQSIWCIGNIAGDCVPFRDKLLYVGAPDALQQVYIKFKQRNDIKGIALKRQIIWGLSNLCRSKPCPNPKLVLSAIPVLVDALKNAYEISLIADIVWAISFILTKDNIRSMVDMGICQELVRILNIERAVISNPALRIMGNITHGDDSDTQIALDAGLLDKMPPLLNHENRIVRMEACWIVSNITAGNCSQVQEVISHKEI